MHLKVLGSAGSECPDNHSPAYLLGNSLLLDAGTIGEVLPFCDQWKLRNVLLSHCHLDHLKGLPFLADNIAHSGIKQTIRLISTPEILDSVSKHIFNNCIWPDFSIIPSGERSVIEYVEIQTEIEFDVDGYSVTALPVNHSVPAVGYLVRKDHSSLLYTGDTGPTERIWQIVENISALIVEVSFSDQMTDLALVTGHLTPSLLSSELCKLNTLPPRIFITHLKPQFRDQIIPELRRLPFPGITLISDGDEYCI